MPRLRSALLLALLATAGGCGGGDVPGLITGAPVDSTPAAQQDVRFSPGAVYQWNARAEYFALLARWDRPIEATHEALIYALVNGAMHDAVNAIVPRYRPFAYSAAYVARSVDDFNPEATVGTAAFTILEQIGVRLAADSVSPNPYPLAFVRREYSNAMLRITDGRAKAAGITLGRDVAVTMLAARPFVWSSDRGMAPYATTGEPGAYRPTAPNVSGTLGTTGFAAFASWATTRSFVLTSPSQFRAPPPYGAARAADAVYTPRYVQDFNEVKRMGGAASERTPDQTEIAFFWAENPSLSWQRIARIQGIAHDLDVWETARLLTLVAFAQADANIVTFDTKYSVPFWRPVTAIRAADTDGNPQTSGDSTWDVASSPYQVFTPATPEFASAHAIAGSAAATIIASLVPPPTGFRMASTVLPDLERSFPSVEAAAQENAESRILIGYHFRHAVEAGAEQGVRLGRFVLQNALPKVR